MAEENTVIIQEHAQNNGRKKLLVIGKTGTGKSSLCNRIVGCQHDASNFPVSAESESCTQKTVFADAFFNGNKENPITVIDTIGFDDPATDKDAEIIAELVDKLQNDCDYINLFAIAVNGQNPRLDGSLLGMIKIFEGMFTKDFWKQVVIVFTRMPMDEMNKRKREKTTKQTDDELAKKYMKAIENNFTDGRGLRYLFLDATYDEEDKDEYNAFTAAMSELLSCLENAPPLRTTNVTKVETENAALKREIKQKAEEREEERQMLREQLKNVKEEYDRKFQLFEQQMKVDKHLADKLGKMKDEIKAEYERMMNQAEADKRLDKETFKVLTSKLVESTNKLVDVAGKLLPSNNGGCIIQ